MDYIFLFFSAFVSATLFPMGSEGVLVYLINSGKIVTLLLLSATLGNSLGAVLNYYFGIKGSDYLIEKKLLTKKRLQQSIAIFNKYGAYSLLLSWVPIIGDPITLIAGMVKYNIKKFILIVAFAKFARYFVLAIGILKTTQ